MNNQQPLPRHTLIAMAAGRVFALIAIMIIFVLIPAGTFHYWQFYLYCATFLIPMIYALIHFATKDPEFLSRRMKFREREPEQRRIVGITMVIFFGGYILAGLDKRYSWSDIPPSAVIIADLVFVASYGFILFVFNVNRFAARVVDVENEQTVISTGPYRFVRHPMYSGLIVMYLATPIVLGSLWAVIPFLSLPIALSFRLLNEEKVLREKLRGYPEYCNTVRYRLIPNVW